MPITIYPKRWPAKPPVGTLINWGHPLSRGLYPNAGGVWLFRSKAGGPRDAISGHVGSFGGGAAWTEQGMSFNASGAFVDTGILTNLSYSSGAVVWSMNPGFSPTDGATHLFWGHLASGVGELSAQKFSDNNWYVGWNISGGTDYRVTLAASSSNLTQGVWQQYVFTWNPGGSWLYRNGVQLGTKQPGPSTVNVGATFAIGTEQGVTGSMTSGQIAYLHVRTNTSLSASDAVALYYDPFCFMQPQSPQDRYWTSIAKYQLDLIAYMNDFNMQVLA